MFLFGVPWGGTLAIKTEVINQTGLLDRWGEVFNDDMMMHNILKRHGWRIKFVPTLIMVNQEECDLASFFESLKRFIISARLYHPRWLALVSDAVSSILFPTLLLGLLLQSLLSGQWYTATLLFTCYFAYTIGLLLLMLAMELGIQQIMRYQGQMNALSKLTPLLILRMFIAIPLTQWIYGVVMVSSVWTPTVKWRGLTYRIQSRDHIRLTAYHPYQWLDQPVDPKVSL
jgi:cellulose synthase/poly-beta-1,6-N-acetylglucosamine synthase-like glycosyltransferase